ncbi:MAG: metal ABC transporter substrate-binding protein [bacterium]
MRLFRLHPPILQVLVALISLGLLLGGASSVEAKSPIKAIATTSLIGRILEEVGDDRVDVVTIIPPGSCPGHFDMRPGDAKAVADADVFFMHGWEGETLVSTLVEASGNPKLKRYPIGVKGNWMVPEVQIAAIEAITKILVGEDPGNGELYKTQSQKAVEKARSAGERARERAKVAGVSGVNVLCAEMQRGFVEWFGFNIVASYGRPEDLNPKVLQELIDKGRSAKVALVIDNLQSGPNEDLLHRGMYVPRRLRRGDLRHAGGSRSHTRRFRLFLPLGASHWSCGR